MDLCYNDSKDLLRPADIASVCKITNGSMPSGVTV